VLLDTHLEFLPWSDVKMYKVLADRVFSGELPYRDFHFEYPPASIVVFALPRLFVSNMGGYRMVFEMMNLLFAFVTMLFGLGIARICNYRGKWVLPILTFGFFVTIQILLERYDTFVMFLTSAGIYSFLYGKKSKMRLWVDISYVLIIIAGFAKLCPFLVIPIFLLYELKMGNLRAVIRGIVLSIITSIPFVLLMISGWEGVKFFLDYHGDRGLEIESTYSGFLLLLQQVGINVNAEIIYAYASYGVAGPIADFLAKASLLIFSIVYLGFIVILYVKKWKKNDYSQIVVYCFISILLFIITNKVFSAQYLLWLYPFILIIPFFKNGRQRVLLIITSLVITVLTIVIYPLFWHTFNKGNILLTGVLVVRNCLLLLLLIKFYLLFVLQEKKYN